MGTRQKKLMVVDDSKTSLGALTYSFEENGYSVVTASTGAEAFKLLTTNKDSLPDLIVCDINMPEMNGIDFITALKKENDLKYIPVVFLTTETQKEVVQKGKELGAAAWLVKPAQPDQLLSLIHKIIG